MSFRPPKGTVDVVPPDSYRWRFLLRAWDELAERYAYPLVMTPVFEPTELFERGVGPTSDVVRKQMYTFDDRGGRSLSLRPEGTAGVVRAYLDGGGSGPWKAAYSGPMFRYERPQAGRRRQFWQIGAEYLGVEGPAADVEVIELAARFLAAAGAATRLVINSLGCPVCRPPYLARLREYLEARRGELTDEHAERIGTNPLRVLDCKECSPKLPDAPAMADALCAECSEHYRGVKEGLAAVGIGFSEDARLVRGLDYYVRTAFEFLSEELTTAQTALAAGGRYDGLSEAIGGRPAPGVGFAAGVDRIVLAVASAPVSEIDVFLVADDGVSPLEALAVASALRAGGRRVDLDTEGRSVKAQLRAATRSGAPATLLVRPHGFEGRRGTDRRELASLEEVLSWLR